MVGSAFYYKTYAKLPDWISPFIYIFLNTIGYLIHPIAFELGSEMLGNLLHGENAMSVAIDIIVLLISAICFSIYMWLMTCITSTSLLFNPCPLLTALGTPQMLIFVSTNLITFILGISSKAEKTTRICLSGVSAIIYGISTFIPFIDGGFVSTMNSDLVLCTSISGCILCISSIVIEICSIVCNEILIFVVVGIYVACYFLATFITNLRRHKCLQILDEFDESSDNFDQISTPRKFYEVIMCGFSYAHQACINWEIFQSAIEQWSHNTNVWVLYAKFVAIYPEESQKLGWIQHQMMSFHLKGSTSKHIQEEIITIIRMRESNISPELKKKLNKITKKVQLLKHKLRHIWDLVIQGNVADMGGFIDNAYKAVGEAEAEYSHILRRYPKSRFVTRSYACFLLDVLADHAGFTEWSAKAKLLQRGIQVFEDHAHTLGMTYFPNIPNSFDKMMTSATHNADSELMDTDETDDKNQSAMEQSAALRKQINDLSIPGTYHTMVHRILIMFVLFLCVLIAATIGVFTVMSTHEAPLEYLHHISMLRTYVFMASSYGVKYIHEQDGLANSRQTYIDDSAESPPDSLGGTWDLKLQFTYVLDKLASSMMDLSGIRALATENEHMDIARTHLYGNSVEFMQFTNTTVNETETTSVQVCVMNFVTQLSNLIESEIDDSVYESSMIVNPTYNANNVADSISEALENVDLYMSDNNTSLCNVFFYIRIILLIVYPVLLLTFLYFEIKEIGSNKLLIYKCMTSLPKNVVSSVSDSLKVMKGEHTGTYTHTEQDSELNKQEENMLKIFATASDTSSSKFSDNMIMVVGTLFTIGLSVLLILEIYTMFVDMSQSIFDSAPNINNLMGAYAYQCSMMMMLTLISSENADKAIYGMHSSELIVSLPTVLEQSLDYFMEARYGSQDGSEIPFSEFDEGITEQNEKNACDSSEIVTPETLRDVYECISLEMLFYVVESFIDTLVQPMSQINQLFLPDDDTLWNLWEIETVFMYDKFFEPIFADIISNVEESMSESIRSGLILCYIILVLEVIVELFVLYFNQQDKNRMHFSLCLLLHCQPSTVSQIPVITNVLSGNFTSQKGDSSLRNKLFFDEVLVQLPDPLLIVDESGTISTANTQAKRMFPIENLVGMRMTDFMDLPMFVNSMDTIRKQAPQEEEISYVDSTNTKFNLTIQSLPFNQMSAYVIRDITQTVRYNTLISEEQAKSDRLLESILPSKLVKRVQQGEKNISFSVQTASIVFMDIVSFTPWCGSLPACKVMEILNLLYKEFDALVAKYPTLTKIKCIGDCYMAAGGIFSDINQPAVHAKEMVEFGLDAINSVNIVNKETAQTLQIRVGINTGGPLVAGVLGSGKPTFEVLGPTINMAQQMEHHGVASQVHISRAVYELIYGGDFKIKERGSIEIKNGSVVTYLVTP